MTLNAGLEPEGVSKMAGIAIDIIYPFVGFVRQIRKDGSKQLYIATKRKRYPSKEYVPVLVKYDPDL